MKKYRLKPIVDIILVLMTIIYINGICKEHNYSIKKFAEDYDKKHKLGKFSESNSVKKSDSDQKQNQVNNGEDDKKIKITSKSGEPIVYIHGFGNYTNSDLEIISNGIENFYGMKSKIAEPIRNLKSKYFITDNTTLSSFKVLELNQNDNNYHIYVTNLPLCENEQRPSLITGYAFFNTKLSVVSTYQMRQHDNYDATSLTHSANHELAHDFGLKHCKDENCLMKPSGLDTKKFCNSCKHKLDKLRYGRN